MSVLLRARDGRGDALGRTRERSSRPRRGTSSAPTTSSSSLRPRGVAAPRAAAARGRDPRRRRARRDAARARRDHGRARGGRRGRPQAIERQLGEVGRKLHAGRSRNDQVAAAFRLASSDACEEADELLQAFADAILDRAAEEAETPMPGYTHLQRAIPVTVGHHLLAWVEMLERDRARFAFAAAQARPSPLGAGALAGSTLPLPPPPDPMRNTIDAVADRDFALDYLYACAVLFTHLSRIGEELVLWTTAEFGFARLPEDGRDGLLDDAAEAQPRRRRARARQGGHRDRAPDRPARDAEVAPARLQPRPAGGQAAGVRRAGRRPRRARSADRARPRARARPGAPRRRVRRPAPARDRRRGGARPRRRPVPRRARAGRRAPSGPARSSRRARRRASATWPSRGGGEERDGRERRSRSRSPAAT